MVYPIMVMSFLKRWWTSIITALFVFSVIFSPLTSVTFAEVSSEYQPNYGISVIWDDVMTNFIAIQSAKKRWDEVSSSVFSTLYTDFSTIFPKLPQNNNYRVTFDSCLAQSQKLGQAYSSLDFDVFMDQCQNPLNTIMKEINSNFTIKAKVKASPQNWSAPMTVTFDARDSIDPSQDTIPSDNFFWYYKNAQGQDVLIGRWAVVKYTFEQEGNYYVHVTARSANKETQGILDGEATIVVTVAPEIANVVVYANGKKLQTKNYTKVGTQEAQRGIVFDGSATVPKWGREIQSHTWEIEWKWYKYASDTIAGKPAVITMKLPNDGSYTVKLSLIDNEWNIITKSFLIAVSDPIALIKQSPEQLTTSTTATFDASASYSLKSRIKKYNREVYDEAGDKVAIWQNKTFSKQFIKPGTYTVKLTVTDEMGESNTETSFVTVESTPPQPQFTIQPRLEWQYPSQFVLDAWASFDVDVTNKFDILTYEWSFSNPSIATIDQSYDNNKSVVVSFNEPGKYKATLTVKDSYGKISTLQRDIDVKSSLRPVILANPRATSRGNTVRFLVMANTDIINYEWDFWDGSTTIVQTKEMTHTFRKAGVYQVKLTATDKRWNKNSVTSPVFIWEKDYPIGTYSIINSHQNTLKATSTCSGNAAFPIKRWEKFSVSTTDSVNSKWEKSNLKFYFEPENDEIYTNNNFQYNFKQVGCKKMNLMVEETSTSKTDKKTIWFDVTNDLPSLDSMSIFFPQFGNEAGVGLGQGTKEKTFDPLKVNPLIVKVTANNAKDRDGSVSQYIWYYYKKDDPTRQLELKSSPWNVPYTYFSIPTNDPALWAGDIVFGVKMVDNDGGEQLSEDIIGQGPSFFIPPCKTGWLCDNNMDVPIVTLKMDKTNASIWEVVNFTVLTKVMSGRPDFEAQRTIQYDYDGDGKRDDISKHTTMTHIYDKKYDAIRPRVQVTYRKNSVTAVGDALTVRQDLKARLDVQMYDKTVYIRDYSLWDIAKKQICFVESGGCKSLGTGDTFLSHTYERYGTYKIVMNATDQYGNNVVDVKNITLQQPQNIKPLYLMTIPQASVNQEGKYTIPVWNGQNNSVLFNAVYSGSGLCYIDTDITDDSNYDGKPDNDQDIPCNTMRMIHYDNGFDTINARVVFAWSDGKLVGNGIIVRFTDQELVLSQTQKLQYNKIKNLIASLPNSNDDQKYIRSLLQKMADTVKVNKSQTENIVNMRVFLEGTKAGLTDKQIESITSLLKEFETSDTIALDGGNVVDQARQFLIDFAPSDEMKSQIIASFDVIKKLPEPAAQPEIVKSEMQKIVQVFESNAVSQLESQNKWNENKVIKDDIETQVLPKVCDVLNFYSISSSMCPDASGVKITTENKTIDSSGRWPILKWVGIGVGILGGIFLLIVIFFAIKARLQQNHDEEEQS